MGFETLTKQLTTDYRLLITDHRFCPPLIESHRATDRREKLDSKTNKPKLK
jgi:hypothetical protein